MSIYCECCGVLPEECTAAKEQAQRAHARTVEAALRGLLDSLDLDCGSSICMFARDRKGMRNNGGCRCIESRKPGAASKVAAAVRAGRAALGGKDGGNG